MARVQMHAQYGDLEDVFGIAGLYAEAIARGHVFNDGNKRTALVCALTYLLDQGIFIPTVPEMDEVMVMLADGDIEGWVFGSFLHAVWNDKGRPTAE